MSANGKNVGGDKLRVEFHVVAGAAPEVARIGEQFVQLVSVPWTYSPAFQIEPNPAALDVMGIEVHDDEHDVLGRCGLLAVGNQVFVIQFVELQTIVALQRGIFAPDAIDPFDEVIEVAGSIAIPIPNFVFFGIEILLRTSFSSGVFTELEGRTVNAVARAERRGQNKSSHEGRASAKLQILWQDVGRVRPEVWAKVFAHARLSQFGEVLSEFPLRVAPGEVVVGLREAYFGQPIHHFWPREGFGKKNQVGMALL